MSGHLAVQLATVPSLVGITADGDVMLEPRLRTMWLANAASGAAAVAVRTPRPAFAARTRRAQREAVVASDLEVVTVTDHSAVITWTTRTRSARRTTSAPCPGPPGPATR